MNTERRTCEETVRDGRLLKGNWKGLTRGRRTAGRDSEIIRRWRHIPEGSSTDTWKELLNGSRRGGREGGKQGGKKELQERNELGRNRKKRETKTWHER